MAVLSRGNQAYKQGNFREAAKLLGYSLNPSFNLPDSVWVVTLQRLAHSLLETGLPDVAGVWLRWALRQRGSMDVDDVNFPPAVIRAFAQAGREVDQTPDSLAMPLVETIWHWPKEPQELVTLGGIVLNSQLTSCAEGRSNDSRVLVGVGRRVNLGPLPLGAVRYLPPETYVLKETGSPCLPGWIYREVLPGVVTEITLGALLTVYYAGQQLLVYVDGVLVGKTVPTPVRSGRGFVTVQNPALPHLPEVRQLRVRPGVRRIELRDVAAATLGDTTITLIPGDVRVLAFLVR